MSDQAKRPSIARDPTIPRVVRIAGLVSYVAMLVCGVVTLFVSDRVHGRVIVSRWWGGLTGICMAVFLVALGAAGVIRIGQDLRSWADRRAAASDS